MSSSPTPQSRPVIYGLMNAAGEFHMSESCIAFTAAELDAELEHLQEGDDTWRIVPLFAVPETASTGWTPVKERQPEGDGDVLVAHPVYAKTATEWCGVTVRSASTVRAWVKYPEDTSMADGFWMYLPKGPL